MKNAIYLIETQPSEWDFFLERLQGFQVNAADDLSGVEADAEAVSVYIHSRIDREFLDSHPNLKLVATRSTGYDHVDIEECARRGVTVCNASSVDRNSVAEHTMALMLAVARRLIEVEAVNKQPRFHYEQLRAVDLRGRTIGIIGTGRVGMRVLHLALAFGMRVIAYDPYNRPEKAESLGVRYVDLQTLIPASQVISLHAPLTKETYHLLGSKEFHRMRPGVILINTARGRLVDTSALIEALDSGIVAGAGLDVLEEESVMQKEAPRIIADQIIENIQSAGSAEDSRAKGPERVHQLQDLVSNQNLLLRTNVVFTPHVAFNSVEAVELINTATVESIRSFFENKPINIVEPSYETTDSLGHSRELACASCGAGS